MHTVTTSLKTQLIHSGTSSADLKTINMMAVSAFCPVVIRNSQYALRKMRQIMDFCRPIFSYLRTES